eukprot:TRINITY_DN74402_c0_g1_i1.p1 TRINITY_DN74402_c0_g1~~TRINITY_DN74402_c0_g1_i1.p1  ORF type:complete len:352 (+),score=110.00 TRINITY_DN74402_c0_g1_i1:61-1116(+)
MGNALPCLRSALESRPGEKKPKPLPKSVVQRAGTKNVNGESLCVGRVKKVLDRRPPFGFIQPDDGSPDLYFNEKLLGDGTTWAQFLAKVKEYDVGNAPVVYVREEYGDRAQAKGVVLLEEGSMKDLDADDDGLISRNELEAFLAAHAELKAASVTKQEREYLKSKEKYEEQKEEDEALAKKRDALYQRQDAAEEKLYKLRDSENAEAKRLFDQGQKLWEQGERDKAKAAQAEAKKHQAKAREYKRQAVDLDWKNNEEMFEWVQKNEHAGQKRDGSWIDLHGLSADFAEQKTMEFLDAAKKKGLAEVQVIPGAGHHSGKGGPVVKRRIIQLFREKRIQYTEETAGSMIVKLK